MSRANDMNNDQSNSSVLLLPARRAWRWFGRQMGSLKPASRPTGGVFCDPDLYTDPANGGAIRFRPRAKFKS